MTLISLYFVIQLNIVGSISNRNKNLSLQNENKHQIVNKLIAERRSTRQNSG